MESLLRPIRLISRAAAIVAGGLLLLAALLIACDVILRKWFHASIGGTDELAGYALAIATAWGIGFTLLSRAHVRVDSFYSLMPLSIRSLLDLVGLLAFLSFFGLLTYHAYGTFARSLVLGSRSVSELSVRLAIPQGIWFLGFAFFLIATAVLLAAATLRLAKGDLAAVEALAGAKSAEQEVVEEKRQLDRLQRG